MCFKTSFRELTPPSAPPPCSALRGRSAALRTPPPRAEAPGTPSWHPPRGRWQKRWKISFKGERTNQQWKRKTTRTYYILHVFRFLVSPTCSGSSSLIEPSGCFRKCLMQMFSRGEDQFLCDVLSISVWETLLSGLSSKCGVVDQMESQAARTDFNGIDSSLHVAFQPGNEFVTEFQRLEFCWCDSLAFETQKLSRLSPLFNALTVFWT